MKSVPRGVSAMPAINICPGLAWDASPAPIPRAYVPRYSAKVIGNAPVESRVTVSGTGDPSGVENCAFHRARFASTLPPWPLPKKYTTTSAPFAASEPAIVYSARRMFDDGVRGVQPAGTVVL